MMAPSTKWVLINASIAAGLILAILGNSDLVSVVIAGILLFGVANVIIWKNGRR